MHLISLPLRQLVENDSYGDAFTHRSILTDMIAACTIIERLTAGDSPDIQPFSSARVDGDASGADCRSVLVLMVNFVDVVSPPSTWDYASATTDNSDPNEGEDLTFAECEKAIAEGKASIVRAIVSLASVMEIFDPALGWFWDHMREWLIRERDDLVSCALLAYGNSARQGTNFPRHR